MFVTAQEKNSRRPFSPSSRRRGTFDNPGRRPHQKQKKPRRVACGGTEDSVVSALSVIFKLASLGDTAMATRLQTSSAALGLRQPRHVITSGSVCVLISSLATPPGCCRSPAFQTWCSPRRARESVLRPSLASVNHPTSRASSTVSESGPTVRSHTCAKARVPPQPEH